MATDNVTRAETANGPGNLVEMSWDPITRIVGQPRASTPRSTSTTARSSSATARRRSSAATASS